MHTYIPILTNIHPVHITTHMQTHTFTHTYMHNIHTCIYTYKHSINDQGSKKYTGRRERDARMDCMVSGCMKMIVGSVWRSASAHTDTRKSDMSTRFAVAATLH